MSEVELLTLFNLDGEPSEFPSVDGPVGWLGAASLRDYLVPLRDLRVPAGENGAPPELERVAKGLRQHGQLRPAWVEEDRVTVVGNGHLVAAAEFLGWRFLAVRLLAADCLDQLTFVDEVERIAPDAVGLFRALTREERTARTAEEELDDINEASRDRDAQWVGLPEFVPAGDPFRLVVSCESEAERDSLLDVLGIATIHKGTRGTLSTWWPDRDRKDLSSLRFEDEP